MFFTDTIKMSNLILILQCVRSVIKGGVSFFLLQTREVKIEWRGEDREQQYSTSHKSSIYIYIFFFFLEISGITVHGIE